jgi:uncharacterized membrane protein YqiK
MRRSYFECNALLVALCSERADARPDRDEARADSKVDNAALADELGAFADDDLKTAFSTLRGGRGFVWPLVHRFFKMDLRPRTTSVRVASAIAPGIVPLTVLATVSGRGQCG